MRLKAEFDPTSAKRSRRGASRRPLRLTIPGSAKAAEKGEVLVHNLSATGALLETSIGLDVGTELEIELPEANTVRAKVVWKSGAFFGCQFAVPLSRAVLSAAQLSSAPQSPASEQNPADRSGTSTELGSRIRQWRQRQGLTAKEFAERMQVSRPTVWAWESGKSKPRRSMLDRIMKVLGESQDPEDFEASGTPGLFEEHETSLAERHESDLLGRPETDLQHTIALSRRQIAATVGTSPDKVRIIVEL